MEDFMNMFWLIVGPGVALIISALIGRVLNRYAEELRARTGIELADATRAKLHNAIQSHIAALLTRHAGMPLGTFMAKVEHELPRMLELTNPGTMAELDPYVDERVLTDLAAQYVLPAVGRDGVVRIGNIPVGNTPDV